MKVKTSLVAALGMTMGLAGAAYADTTYHFQWDHGETHFFEFSSTEWLPEDINNPDSWDADLNGFNGITAFDATNSVLHPTAQTFGGVTIQARVVIENVTGSVDFINTIGNWSLTAHVAFSATGNFTEGSCKTSSFTITLTSGDYNGGATSSAFTVPSLSGSGSQACSTHSAAVNTAFSLGGTNARLHFNKFTVTPA
jgi:hypothetical protein